jgi:hypothetical protein
VRYVRALLLIALLVTSLAPAAAQEQEDENRPLFELLALVPDNDKSRVQGEWQTRAEELTVSYVNFNAAENAREPVVSPDSYEAFMALSEDMQALWLWNLSRVALTGELLSLSMWTHPEFVRDSIGFEVFDIDQYGVVNARRRWFFRRAGATDEILDGGALFGGVPPNPTGRFIVSR